MKQEPSWNKGSNTTILEWKGGLPFPTTWRNSGFSAYCNVIISSLKFVQQYLVPYLCSYRIAEKRTQKTHPLITPLVLTKCLCGNTVFVERDISRAHGLVLLFRTGYAECGWTMKVHHWHPHALLITFYSVSKRPHIWYLSLSIQPSASMKQVRAAVLYYIITFCYHFWLYSTVSLIAARLWGVAFFTNDGIKIAISLFNDFENGFKRSIWFSFAHSNLFKLL